MARDESPNGAAGPHAVRFEATVRSTSRAKALAVIADLDLDRLPDVSGKVRLLISAEDARRLLERGFEVHLLAAIPIKPFARELVMSDQQSQNWLDQQLKGIRRKGRD